MTRIAILRALTEAPQRTDELARAAYIRSTYQTKKLLRPLERDGLVTRGTDAEGRVVWWLTEEGLREQATG